MVRNIAKKRISPQFSVWISDVCSAMDMAVKDYEWNSNEVHRMDLLTQDYLHTLELGELGYSERAKIATQLKNCRKLRRECKDTVEILTPLVQFLDSDRGKQLVNLLREALGKTRKVEKMMETRVYHPRVLTENGE